MAPESGLVVVKDLRDLRLLGRLERYHIWLESHDVVFQAELDYTHAVRFGFFQRPLALPAVMGDSVAGDHRSGAVCTPLAVHKHRLFGVQERENFSDLPVRRSDDPLHRDIDIAHSSGGHLLGFSGSGVFILAAEIDDSLDAHFCQVLPSFAPRLAPTVDVLIDLVEVGDNRTFGEAFPVLLPATGRPYQNAERQGEGAKRLVVL